jgi:uncharacterized membrane protein YeiH
MPFFTIFLVAGQPQFGLWCVKKVPVLVENVPYIGQIDIPAMERVDNFTIRGVIVRSHMYSDIFYIFDLFGTFAFAVSGAFKAVKYELDVLGLLVLSTLTGIGGGIIRDIVIGHLPPDVLRNEMYIIVCAVGGILVFFLAPRIAKHWNLVLIADAIGLGVFAGIGGMKGVDSGMGGIGIVILGVLTATGGGVIRDILVSEIPNIIKTDFYATAAILGCTVMAILNIFKIDRVIMLLACIAVTIVSRIIAMRFKLALPRVKSLPESPTKMTERYYKEKKKEKDH